MKKSVEEAVIMRHFCRHFAMKVTKPTVTHEDNALVVVNCANLESTLSLKSMSMSYHFVREHCHGGVAEIRKIGADDDVSDA